MRTQCASACDSHSCLLRRRRARPLMFISREHRNSRFMSRRDRLAHPDRRCTVEEPSYNGLREEKLTRFPITTSRSIALGWWQPDGACSSFTRVRRKAGRLGLPAR
eukprot:scaffold24723_cov131-Isochrysis_galbana.AAC.9